MDDEQPAAAELRRVLLSQPVAHVVGLGRVVHHHEQHRLAAQRRELVAVLLPALDAGREVRLIAHAGHFRRLFGDALGDAFQRPLHDVVDDGLLERVVEYRPRKELPLGVPWRRREVQLRGQAAGRRGVKPADGLVPFALFVVRVVGLVVQHHDGAAAFGDPRQEVFDLLRRRRRLRPQHGRHHVRLVVFRVLPLVHLLDVGQVQRPRGPGPLALRRACSIGESQKIRSSSGITGSADEDPAAAEVGSQPLEDDDVGGDDQEGPGVVVARLGHGVEVLPGDGQRHHLRLAAAGRHLDAVAGEVVVLQELQVRPAGEGFEQPLLPAHLDDLEQVDERFDGVPLGVVVGEAPAVRQAVVGEEPVVRGGGASWPSRRDSRRRSTCSRRRGGRGRRGPSLSSR